MTDLTASQLEALKAATAAIGTSTSGGQRKLTQDDFEKYVVVTPEGASVMTADWVKEEHLPEETREEIVALRKAVAEVINAMGLEWKPRGAQVTNVSKETVSRAQAVLQALQGKK